MCLAATYGVAPQPESSSANRIARAGVSIETGCGSGEVEEGEPLAPPVDAVEQVLPGQKWLE